MHKSLLFIVLFFILAIGCSGPELERSQERSKVTLTGDFLTQNPDVVNFPVRIVIAIDDSASMMDSDPEDIVTGNPKRLDAAWQFVQSYESFESVSFDIVHWNNGVIRSTVGAHGGFSRDPDMLYDDIYPSVNSNGTNYTDTISTIQNHFLDEISGMRNDVAQSANVARMRCIVLFFSDGLPNPWSELTYGPLYQQIRNMKERIVDIEGAASFKFHAMLLSTELRTEDPALFAQAQTLMTNMASNGGGVYQDFETPDQINFINIVDLRLTVEYKVKFIIAFNNNVRPGTELIMIDSDGDGLTDDEEDINGNGIVDIDDITGLPTETNPRIRDSDGDGLSDYFERKLSTIDETFNPLDPTDSTCPTGAEEIDRDMDGMTDCEEASKGTVYTSTDTDSDGIPDGIEFYMGSDPHSNEDSQDTDFDGVDDWEEVQRHTNVNINDEKIRQRYSYYYDIQDQGLVQLYQDSIFESRRRRISFDISNIDIVGTLAADGREAGDNLIRFFIAEVPQDMPNSIPVFRVADIIVNYYDTESRTIEVDSFEAL